jgi:hypothetical protein
MDKVAMLGNRPPCRLSSLATPAQSSAPPAPSGPSRRGQAEPKTRRGAREQSSRFTIGL